MSARVPGWAGVLLAVPPLAGALLCGWLASEFLAVFGGGVASGLFCGGASSDCAAAAAHPSALLLGYPLAGWGLGFQLVLLALALGVASLRDPERETFLAAGTALAASGSLFALWLVRVMVVELGATCGACLLAHGLTLLSLIGFAATWRHGRSGSPVHWRLLLPAPRAHAADESTYFKSLIKLLGWLVLLVALGLSWSRIHTPLSELRDWGAAQVAAFHARRVAGEPALDLTRFDDQPWRGAADAPVRVVVVGDFECNQCRTLARTLDELRAEWPGLLRTSFVNAPLSSRCNPAVPTDLHPLACWLAAAGECAAEQGRFDAFHELLFRELPPSGVEHTHVEAQLEQLGLERRVFEACMEQGRGAEAVAGDLALCRELGLTTTPSLVIEGHVKLGSVHPWMLRAMLAPLVEEARR